MKSNAQSSLYFSAYPLKAIKQSTEKSSTIQSPYLRSTLGGTSARTTTRLRVFPMVNPYTKKTVVVSRTVQPKQVEISGEEWFNNYE